MDPASPLALTDKRRRTFGHPLLAIGVRLAVIALAIVLLVWLVVWLVSGEAIEIG